MSFERYHRQMLLPQIAQAGQRRLAGARVMLVGCGALGTTIADQLVRAGIGHLTIADRDIVELTNLQRQTLFDENDARQELPKAIAAQQRLHAVNSSAEVKAIVADVHPGNIEDLLSPGYDLLLDGTDNVQTRYVLNDVSVKHGIPWIYGAVVGMEGRVMGILPGKTPCLRCIFPHPPEPRELPTCDTAGVLGMGAGIVGAHQAIQAIKLLVGVSEPPVLLRFDFWPARMHGVSLVDARDAECPCCGRGRFDFLDAPADLGASLCGRDAVQVRPAKPLELRLTELAARLGQAGAVERTAYFVRCRLFDPSGVSLTVFPDGRVMVHGVSELGRAKSICARFVGQ